MTAFSTEEHGMMRGIWLELETMNRSLTSLVELLERQEQAHQVVVLPEILEAAPDVDVPTAEERLARTRAIRREMGLCMLCGASRVDAGEGCYKWAPLLPYVEVWAPHSWPEETPEREQVDEPCKHYRSSYWRNMNRYCGDCHRLIDSGAGWSPAH